MEIRDLNFRASAISQEANTETKASYKERISEYRNINFTHIPLPEEGQFYHVKEDWIGPISGDQWIEPETHLLDVLELLQELPFLIYEEPDEKYWIINLADLNKRAMREMLYPVIAELESTIARRIEDHYSVSKDFINHMPDGVIEPHTVGSWYRDLQSDVELHIAEYMNLTEMMKVLQNGQPSLCQSCGFESKGDITDMYAIRDLRNKVMHVNRSLIRSRDDIQATLNATERAQELIQRATGHA